MIVYFAFKTYATISRGWGICSLLSSPPPGICHPKQKSANAWGLARGGGGGGWAQLELTDRGGEWSLKIFGSRKILADFHESRSLVFPALVSVLSIF